MPKIRTELPAQKSKMKLTKGNKPHDSAVPKNPVVCRILNSYNHSFFKGCGFWGWGLGFFGVLCFV